jgi:hypothetical protein
VTTLLDLPPLKPWIGEADPEPERYVGTYVDDWGGEAEVTLDEGLLHLSRPGCDLQPLSARNYLCDIDVQEGPFVITFLLDDAGAVEWLRWDRSVARRVVEGG